MNAYSQSDINLVGHADFLSTAPFPGCSIGRPVAREAAPLPHKFDPIRRGRFVDEEGLVEQIHCQSFIPQRLSADAVAFKTALKGNTVRWSERYKGVTRTRVQGFAHHYSDFGPWISVLD